MRVGSQQWKVLQAFLRSYPTATTSDWCQYWSTLNSLLEVRQD